MAALAGQSLAGKAYLLSSNLVRSKSCVFVRVYCFEVTDPAAKQVVSSDGSPSMDFLNYSQQFSLTEHGESCYLSHFPPGAVNSLVTTGTAAAPAEGATAGQFSAGKAFVNSGSL